MLRQINIQNFAIIEKMSIDFNDGLTVITGQTGAGKSIVIDAIEQLLGARASANLVASNKDYATIEGVFETNNDIRAILETNNIDIDDDYLFILKKIKSDGKSQIRINNKIVTNELVKQLTPLLLEIHSQNATYSINSTDVQQKIIDSLFTSEEYSILQEYKIKYKEYLEVIKEKDTLTKTIIDPELLDFYQDQLNEINKVNIEEAELVELQDKEKYYEEYEKLFSSINLVLQTFDQSNVIDSINRISNELEKVSDISEKYNEFAHKSNELYYEIIDLKDSIKSENDTMFFDQNEYDIIKERLYNYEKMIKKYSYSKDILNDKIIELTNKISFINNSDDLIVKLDNKINNIESLLDKYANELDRIRQKYIDKIEKSILIQFKDLYLNDSTFKIKLESTPYTNIGKSKVVFYFSANKGSDLKQLNQVASGGEMSRFMLALKTISLKDDKMYIFDEIDTGVSGEIANAIGKKIKEISLNHNVICISHLPQVAAFSDSHLYIEKTSNENVTTSNCFYLDEESKINEIAKMLSSDKISDAAIQQAKELINNGNIK